MPLYDAERRLVQDGERWEVWVGERLLGWCWEVGPYKWKAEPNIPPGKRYYHGEPRGSWFDLEAAAGWLYRRCDF